MLYVGIGRLPICSILGQETFDATVLHFSFGFDPMCSYNLLTKYVDIVSRSKTLVLIPVQFIEGIMGLGHMYKQRKIL